MHIELTDISTQVLFTNYVKSFEKVNSQKVWKILDRSGICSQLIEVIRSLFAGLYFYQQVLDYLFNLYLDKAMAGT